MKISKKDFLVKAGLDISGFDDSSIDFYTKQIKGYMSDISLYLLKFANIERFNIVKLSMNISSISVSQIMLDKYKLYQKVTITGESGTFSDRGYLNRVLYDEMKSGKVVPLNV
jgi:hypothetical protein